MGKYWDVQDYVERNLIEYYWQHVDDTDGINDCWVWKSNANRHKKTVSTYNGYKVHELSLKLTRGLEHENDNNYHVVNTCGTVNCCNPFHLKEELKSRNYNNVLKENDVLNILWVLNYQFNKKAVLFLSLLYNCSLRTIYDIKNRRTWKHVNIPKESDIPEGKKPYWNQELEDDYKRL